MQLLSVVAKFAKTVLTKFLKVGSRRGLIPKFGSVEAELIYETVVNGLFQVLKDRVAES